MIHIVNLNPSIDYHLEVKDFKVNHTNRSLSEEFLIGGKGVNVSIVLNNLGVENYLTGYLGGFTGYYISKRLEDFPNIHDSFIQIDQKSRINIKMKMEGGIETEVNASGPTVDEKAIYQLDEKLKSLNDGDVLVLSGSLIPGMPTDWYLDVVETYANKGVKVFMDYASPMMLESLKEGVYLIKPNQYEFELMMNKSYQTHDEMIKDAKNLMNQYPNSRMMLSLGNEGSYLINSKNIYFAPTIKGDVIHTVGAGDSMIAGYLYGLNLGLDEVERFKMAVAAATASVLSDRLAKFDKFNEYLEKVIIKEERV